MGEVGEEDGRPDDVSSSVVPPAAEASASATSAVETKPEDAPAGEAETREDIENESKPAEAPAPAPPPVEPGAEHPTEQESKKSAPIEGSDTVSSQESSKAAPGESEKARPWSTDTGGAANVSKKVRRAATDEVLRTVDRVRSQLPTWQRALADALTALGTTPMAQQQVKELLAVKALAAPGQAAAEFKARDDATRALAPGVEPLSAHFLLGPHLQNLVLALQDAETWWVAAHEAADTGDYDGAKFRAGRAAAALGGAMQHAMYLTFLRDARDMRVGMRTDIAGYCEGWYLSDRQVAGLTSWVKNDGLRLGSEQLPLALDSEARGVYRKATAVWSRLFTALTPIWGVALVYGVSLLFFAILNTAGILSWPTGKWAWKLLAVVLCVSVGALAHVAARGLNINYDNPINVYNAGGIWDWLSLRWLGILYMFIPVAVAVAVLWGTKTIPGSFKDLGAAILAGYSADSVLRGFMTNLQQQSGASQTPAASQTSAGSQISSNDTPPATTSAKPRSPDGKTGSG
jgi:hypothetical protein